MFPWQFIGEQVSQLFIGQKVKKEQENTKKIQHYKVIKMDFCEKTYVAFYQNGRSKDVVSSCVMINRYYEHLCWQNGIQEVLYCCLLNFQVTLRASSAMHNDIFKKVMASPMTFFDTTPVGRIINRFSSDLDESMFYLLLLLFLNDVNTADVTKRSF